jgi:hypothetical protein
VLTMRSSTTIAKTSDPATHPRAHPNRKSETNLEDRRHEIKKTIMTSVIGMANSTDVIVHCRVVLQIRSP